MGFFHLNIISGMIEFVKRQVEKNVDAAYTVGSCSESV